MPSAPLIAALLLVACFSLSTVLETWYQGWAGSRTEAVSLSKVLLGDSRRMFANHFFVKADEYFHGGYYPSIFDQAEGERKIHMAETANGPEKDDLNDLPDFLGKSTDWISRFGRHFVPTQHRHPGDTEQIGEILPWLRLSADLDPHRVQTYTIAAYWLRTGMGRVHEAEQFLREGLQANPDSYEILFELGRVYEENRRDPARARNLWETALRKWQKREGGTTAADTFSLEQILGHLAQLEEREGHWSQAIDYWERIKKISPVPAEIQKGIDELKAKSSPPPK